MPNAQPPSSSNRPPAHDGRYFKVQIKGWTTFDPTGKELNEILAALEQGQGVVTVIEVTEVANTVLEIKDPEIREHFEDAAAVERIVKKMDELPDGLKDKLRSAVQKQSKGQPELLAG
jgi:ribosomal 30S subunit maturation factor RimM